MRFFSVILCPEILVQEIPVFQQSSLLFLLPGFPHLLSPVPLPSQAQRPLYFQSLISSSVNRPVFAETISKGRPFQLRLQIPRLLSSQRRGYSRGLLNPTLPVYERPCTSWRSSEVFPLRVSPSYNTAYSLLPCPLSTPFLSLKATLSGIQNTPFHHSFYRVFHSPFSFFLEAQSLFQVRFQLLS